MKTDYRRILTLIVAVICSIKEVYGNDITLHDGTVLKNASIRKANPAFLTIAHEAGISHIPFRTLPLEMQERYGYDPVKSAQYVKLAKLVNEYTAELQKNNKIRTVYLNEKKIKVEGKVFQVIKEGMLIDLHHDKREWNRNIEEIPASTMLGPSGLGPHKVDKSRWNIERIKLGICLIVGIANVVEGAGWQGDVWYIGNYDYTTVLGKQETIPKFTTNINFAAKEKGMPMTYSPVAAEAIQKLQSLEAEQQMRLEIADTE